MRALHLMCVVGFVACSDAPDDGYEAGEELSGGATTVFEDGRSAFSLSARNLT
ncbi:MAG: thiol oxidoreductase, partial [Deltaproteobacteria bacterium]|nr:thiol oxidoreductase [Deltaproteobacteria bacterium]